METEYDIIIIGAGSAGCVLANRLSEDASCHVLLIEAGASDRHPLISIPAAFSELFKTSFDWNYNSEPQSELNDQEMYSPRGKVIGGCSSINAMIFVRAHAKDFDDWIIGEDDFWSWRNVLPFFQKVERQFGFSIDENGDAISEENYYQHDLTDQFLQSAKKYGLKSKHRCSSANEGAIPFLKNIKKGSRFSAADAYLHPIQRRPNLTIVKNCLVDKIEIKNSKANSVAAIHNGKQIRFHATSNIILSAGAYNSPQIAMRSGIGEEGLLKALGIKANFINPHVGTHLEDHIICGLSYQIKDKNSLDVLNTNFGKAKAGLQYLFSKSGPMTSNIAEAGAFLCLGESERPDLQLHFGPMFFIRHGFVKPKAHGFSLGPTLLHPASQGYLKLRSTNPLDAPLINPQYLTDPKDMAMLIEGMKISHDIIHQQPLSNRIDKIFLPATEPKSDADYEKQIREYTQTLYHPTSTCRIGSADEAVVDARLNVYGIENLKIVDASVLPHVTSSNTQLVTMMLAERIADYMQQR